MLATRPARRSSPTALVRIDTDPSYQRPDWRAVAKALGPPTGPRAVVVYDGLATDPLAVYLRGVPWTDPVGPVSVDEVDVVGYPWQTMAVRCRGGVKLIATKRVNDSLVARFSIADGWRFTAGQVAIHGGRLLGPAPQGAACSCRARRTAG